MSTAVQKTKPTVVDVEKQIRRGKAVLRELKATLEDLEDRRELAAAKKRNGASPAYPCAKPPGNWACNSRSRYRASFSKR